jgi:Flp pilus assembly pilin Flp
VTPGAEIARAAVVLARQREDLMDRFYAWARALKDESGQTFVEYALVLSVIVVGVLLAATWTGLTGAITGAINTVINAF